MATKPVKTDNIIRVSFIWLLLGAVFIVLLGMLGGVLAGQIWPPAAPAASGQQEQLITNVKKVTISPNTFASESLKNAERSVVALVKDNAALDRIATGVVITNDGLLVTSAFLPKTPIAAVDWRGAKVPLDAVGQDDLFGLSYFRVKDGILSPLDISPEAVPVAYELLAVGRANITALPLALSFPVAEVILPPPISPAGWQRLYRGPANTEETLAGSPLIDDEGKVAGLLYNAPAGLAIPGDQLLASIRRVAAGEREQDPFATLGFSVRYRLTRDEKTNERQFMAEVVEVNAQSTAGAAGLEKSDLIRQVNGQILDWQHSLVKILSAEQPVTLTVWRNGQDLNLNLN